MGSFFGRNSLPSFLKFPTNSFFFVSTEITGWFLLETLYIFYLYGLTAGRDQDEKFLLLSSYLPVNCNQECEAYLQLLHELPYDPVFLVLRPTCEHF